MKAAPLDFVVAKKKQTGYLFASLEAEEQKKMTMLTAAQWRELPFEEAAQEWLERKKLSIAASTVACYRDYILRLESAFNGMKLGALNIGHFLEYQRINRDKYHPASVNHDLNTLLQIMAPAEMRVVIEAQYAPLPLPKAQPVKVLTEDEEDKFFEFASKGPGWFLAYWVASFSNNTTGTGIELRMMTISDVHLEMDPPLIFIPQGKNDYRPRTIPLNTRAKTIMERIVKRARLMGSYKPEHYLFPFRIKRNCYDPARPASESWLKYQWKKLVTAALAENIITFAIKPHNLRNNAITNMLQAGIPIELVRSIAGHINERTTRGYHQARLAAMHRAMEAVNPDRKRAAAAGNGGGKKSEKSA